MPRVLPKSKRQYVQHHNTPTRALLLKFKQAKPAPMPEFIEPLFPVVRDRPPVGDNWVHEIKFDGYRFQMHVRYGQPTRLFTRRGHDWSQKAKSIAIAASDLRTDSAVIDGEIAVLGPDGTSDFNELERELGKGDSDRLTFFGFDVLYLDGHDIRRETLLNRKHALQTLLEDLPADSPIKYSEHLEGDALRMKQEACGFGLEGVVSKLKDSAYVSGRSDHWVKTPCRRRDTFAIVGWAQKGRKFDGFYLGEKRKGKLAYAGKIESGWTEKERDDLLAEVQPLQRRGSPLSTSVEKPKAKWVEPRVLVDVEYRTKTRKSGLLRHPSFKGVRRDLDPLEPRRSKAR